MTTIQGIFPIDESGIAVWPNTSSRDSIRYRDRIGMVSMTPMMVYDFGFRWLDVFISELNRRSWHVSFKNYDSPIIVVEATPAPNVIYRKASK